MNEPIDTRFSDPYRLVGTLFTDQYTITSVAGIGGMSVVYRASPNAYPNVAIKVINPNLLAKQGDVYFRLFKQEVELARRLKHPCIIETYDSGISKDGFAFIALEWLDGHTLADELISCGKLSSDRVLAIFSRVCSALAAAHRARILHLDIKPSNIFVLSDAVAEPIRVIDFGLARAFHSSAGTTLSRYFGTLHYSAPEIFAHRACKESDIYSLGVTLFEALAGVLPYGTSNIRAMVNEFPLQPPPSLLRLRPDLSVMADTVIGRALSKNPSDRQRSADDFYSELQLALSFSPTRERVSVPSSDPFLVDVDPVYIDRVPIEYRQAWSWVGFVAIFTCAYYSEIPIELRYFCTLVGVGLILFGGAHVRDNEWRKANGLGMSIAKLVLGPASLAFVLVAISALLFWLVSFVSAVY